MLWACNSSQQLTLLEAHGAAIEKDEADKEFELNEPTYVFGIA